MCVQLRGDWKHQSSSRTLLCLCQLQERQHGCQSPGQAAGEWRLETVFIIRLSVSRYADWHFWVSENWILSWKFVLKKFNCTVPFCPGGGARGQQAGDAVPRSLDPQDCVLRAKKQQQLGLQHCSNSAKSSCLWVQSDSLMFPEGSLTVWHKQNYCRIVFSSSWEMLLFLLISYRISSASVHTGPDGGHL